MPRPVLPPELLGRPFSRQQALAAGLTDTALQSAPWRQLLRGVYAHECLEVTRETRLSAAKLVLPMRAVLCGLTAAWIYGADVRREEDLDVHVSFPRGGRIRSRPGLRVCQETLAPTDVWQLRDVAITSPVRTVFDCMRLLRGDQRLVVADAMAHLGRVRVDELRTYFHAQRGVRNLRVAEALIDDVEPKAESPMETRLRLCLCARGLPRPVAQHEVTTQTGVFVARLDLACPEAKLAIEYDGAWHWKVRRADERRRAAVRALGWEVLVYDSDDVHGSPDRVAAEVRAALRMRSTASSRRAGG